METLNSIHSIMSEILREMKNQKIPPQTPASDLMEGFSYISSSPPAAGFCRLIDGTVIQVAGSKEVRGDPIKSEMNIQGHSVSFDATGVAAVRLDPEGRVQALAAGGLKRFSTGKMEILLDERVDLAMWINQDGNWEGVLQGWKGDVPPQLLKLTDNWARLGLPVPFNEQNRD